MGERGLWKQGSAGKCVYIGFMKKGFFMINVVKDKQVAQRGGGCPVPVDT